MSVEPSFRAQPVSPAQVGSPAEAGGPTQAGGQAWQEIRDLIGELTRLAHSDASPTEFYAEFLNRVVTSLAAIGGAVWTQEGGRLQLEHQMQLEQVGLLEQGEVRRSHHRLLSQMMSLGEPALVPPHSGSGEDSLATNETDFLLILAPIKLESQVVGMVEVIQRPNMRPSAQRGSLQFVSQITGAACDYLKTRRLRQLRVRQELWGELEDFTRAIHSSLDPRRTAYTLANEGRRLIGCDRLSVALPRGRKSQIEAISGQDLLDRRSNAVRLLGRLATAVVAAGDPLWYSGDPEGLPPQLEHALTEYVEHSHAKVIAVYPLQTQPEPSPESSGPAPAGPIVGTLIAEWFAASMPSEGPQQRIEAISEHGALAISNAVEYRSLFLLPLWKALGQATWVLRARTLPKTLSVLAVVVAAVAALVYVPADFDLRGDGTLQPELRRNVFAPADGVIRELRTEHGQAVQEKDTLLVMRNAELELRLSAVEGEIQTSQKKLHGIINLPREEDEGQPRQSIQNSQIAAEEEELKKTLESLTAQLALLVQQKAELQVPSPISGSVTTWNVADLLSSRPVRRGEVLLSVANLEGAWVLEVQMPEDRMGHVLAAQRELGPELRAPFILATNPGKTYSGTVLKIAKSAEVDEEKGNSVLVTVRFDKEQLEAQDRQSLRPGAGVTVKIHCGRRAIGYVWFHDLYEVFQSRVLFRL